MLRDPAPTYERFQKLCLWLQRLGIRRNQRRMQKAWNLWHDYQRAMLAIGLHALSREEITQRMAELDRMWRAAEETHGDTAGMRASYEMRYGIRQSPPGDNTEPDLFT